MSKMPWHPASGTGLTYKMAKKVIRFARYGCTNRPFYHIVVMEARKPQRLPPIEQLGTHDPIPNVHNEKLTSINFERMQYWLARGAHVSVPIAELLGLSGYFPVHPRTHMIAWRKRETAEKAAKAAAEAAEKESATAES